MSTSESPGVPALLDRIRREIRDAGPIPFSRFMLAALHDPEHGYYARGEERIGRGGDFYTASDVGPAFGRCLARQLHEMDEVLGRPDPFTVVEFGGGRGLLAMDILDAAEAAHLSLSRRMGYALVDASPGMREAAARTAPRSCVVTPHARIEGQVGCSLAVELFDALPVDRVRRSGDDLREVYVDVDPDGRLVEREGDPRPETRALADRYGAAPNEGDEAEVCPGAAAQLEAMAGALERGFILIVDYGYGAEELYGPAHNRGTLLAYHRHTTNEEYLLRVGEQDLTAHVNFTALEDHAAAIGLDVLGRTSQDRFLIANGILGPLEEEDPAKWGEPSRVQERLRVMQLIHPMGMGRTFRVIVLSKGVGPAPVLDGLRDPFARGAVD